LGSTLTREAQAKSKTVINSFGNTMGSQMLMDFNAKPRARKAGFKGN